MRKKDRRLYSREFKLEAVNLAKESGKPIMEINFLNCAVVNSDEVSKTWVSQQAYVGRATTANLALTPAGGNGVGVLIRPSLTPSASLRACGSAWSLSAIVPPDINS